MKTVNAATNQENTAEYFVDVYGDIHETLDDAEEMGVSGKVIVDGLYVGSADQMRAAALQKYLSA